MRLSTTLLATLLSAPLLADTVYTIPQGYTRITLEEAPSAGTSSLTALSVVLLQDLAFAGSVTIGEFSANPTGEDTQAASVSGVAWTANQWTSEPYLAYLSVTDDAGNADGISPAQEAFLISANTTTGGLTLVSRNVDLLTNFPASSTIKIRKANTLSSLLASITASIHANDRIYIWNQADSKWDTFRFITGPNIWINTVTNTVSNDMVVFPEEGMFIERTQTTPVDLQLTLFGEIPSAPQISSIEGSGFMSSRIPLDSALGDLGIENANWSGNDRVFIWNPDVTPQVWETHRFIVGPNLWFNTGTNAPSGDRIVTASSAVFVDRTVEVTPGTGQITTSLPYTVD